MSKHPLKEFLKDESIFLEISNIESFPFIDTENIPTLDTLLLVTYGNKLVYGEFNDVNIELIAKMLVIKNRQKWLCYIEAEQLLGNVNTRREITETITDSETRTGERTDINKVSAYNSDELLTDGGNDNSSTDILDGEKTRTLTDETIDVKHAYTMLNLVGKDTVASKVIADVAQFLTLSIY